MSAQCDNLLAWPILKMMVDRRKQNTASSLDDTDLPVGFSLDRQLAQQTESPLWGCHG